MARPDTVSDYRRLLREGQPLLDLRAPCEFARGAFPAAVNIPLLDDEERRQVGLRYKQGGQQAAIELGHRLVRGEVKQARVAAWCRFARDNPHGHLYCFRGGLRSRLVQQWMTAAGTPYPRIAGGYKAMRRFLMDNLQLARQLPLLLIGGKTGSGKTRLLARLSQGIDLEALACHRGSAFGRRLAPQPSQIDFENALSVAVLRLPPDLSTCYVEDESRSIGRVYLPPPLFQAMEASPLALLEVSLTARVGVILEDYVAANFADFSALAPQRALEYFTDYLHGSLRRMQRRLGGKMTREVRHDMDEALREQVLGHGMGGHRRWIAKLLKHYYDPMYEHQLEQRRHRVIFRGGAEEFLAWAQRREASEA